jgi:hypothetical protein
LIVKDPGAIGMKKSPTKPSGQTPRGKAPKPANPE